MCLSKLRVSQVQVASMKSVKHLTERGANLYTKMHRMLIVLLEQLWKDIC